MEERRKLKRKYLVFFTRIFDRQTGQLLGHLANVTAGGLMLISERPIEIEITYKMSMDLPEYVFGTDHLDFTARSVYCSPDIDPDFYNTGFQFINIKPKDLEIIEQIIEAYGIRE